MIIIETVTLSFSSADELMNAEVIVDQLLSSEQLENLETGIMHPGNMYYMQIHEPISYSEFTAFCNMLPNK